MPTTARANLPYPASTDAPDVPSDLQALAEALDLLVPTVVRRSSTKSVTSNTTLASDDQLTYGALDVGTWRVQAVLRAAGATAGDIKIAWDFDGALIRSSRTCLGPALGATDAADTNMRAMTAALATGIGYGVTPTDGSVITEDLLLEVSIAGFITLQWAQNSSSATATTLTDECRLYIQQVAVP